MKTALAAAALAIALASGCAHAPKVPVAAWGQPTETSDVRVDLAEAMVATDRPEAALKIIRTARDEGIQGPDLTVVQAKALLAKGLDGEAQALLDEVLRTTPRHAGALAVQGVLYLDQKRIEEATAALAIAARRSPGDARLLNNYGFSLLVSGRYADSEEALREALRLDPSNARARNNLGFALAALGRTQEAREAFLAVVTEEEADHNLRLAAQLYPPTETPEAP